MNGSQMLDIMGLIDPAFIEAAETAGTCAKPAHISVFRKRPWVKWAAAAAAVLIVAAGAPGAIYMMGHFGGSGFVDPRGGSETPGIIPSDGSEGSGQSGESETPGSSGTAGDNEQENTPKPGGETTSDIPGNSSQNSGGSDSDIPGGEQHETPEEPREIVISGWETPSGESGTFVKENMPNITLKIYGSKRSFHYQSSSYIRSTDGIAFDGKDVYYSIDRYINDDGTVIEKYGGATRILQCECPPGVSGDGPMDVILSNAAAERKARLIAWYTDIDLDGLENAVASVRKDGNIYCVTLTVPDGSVELRINTRGSLISIKVTEGTPHQPSEDRIAAAKEKMYAKLDELNKETSGGKYVLDKAHFEAWGENTYIVFAVNYYHDAHSDVYSVRDYYFLV